MRRNDDEDEGESEMRRNETPSAIAILDPKEFKMPIARPPKLQKLVRNGKGLTLLPSYKSTCLIVTLIISANASSSASDSGFDSPVQPKADVTLSKWVFKLVEKKFAVCLEGFRR